MRKRFLLSILLTLVILSSCHGTGGGQRGTVLMRDGTSVSGTIVSNSGSEIQIAGDDKITRTIPTNQVRSISYDETPPATPDSNAVPPAVPAPAAPTPSPVPVPPH